MPVLETILGAVLGAGMTPSTPRHPSERNGPIPVASISNGSDVLINEEVCNAFCGNVVEIECTYKEPTYRI